MAAQPKYKTGDAVRLKSGGPKMTVSHATLTEKRRSMAERAGDDPLREPEYVWTGDYSCKWFLGARLHEGTFGEDELEPSVEQPESKRPQ